MKYEKIRDSLKTGDVLLFEGKGFFSWVIKRATGSRNSHIGIVYRPAAEVVLTAESTTLSTVKDYFKDRKVKGVQFVSLSERIRTYKGKIWVRQLARPMTADERAAFEEAREEFKDRKYEQSVWQLIRAGFKWKLQKEDLSSLFCSEFITVLFKRIGYLLKNRFPSNEINPWDYGWQRLIDEEMALAGKNRLMVPIRLEK